MNISARDVRFAYSEREVLKGVTLEVGPNKIVCIAGPNGSGKSTLIKCLEGLLLPSSGSVFLDEIDLASIGPREIARRIGYVPQSTTQLFSMSVFDTVLMGRKPHYRFRCSDRDIDIVADVLQLMDLGGLAMDEFNQLSGGQQQRVLIARALAQQPELLLLDEPTSALDIAHQLEVMDILGELVQSTSLGVIMVVHDLNLASRYADRIVLLKDGSIFASGAPHETLTAENIASVYGVEVHLSHHDGFVSVTPFRRMRETSSERRVVEA